jgi:hypothetical protein
VKSSRNAFRHGLPGPLPLEFATSLEIDAIALATQGAEPWSGARAFAEAQLELWGFALSVTRCCSGSISSKLIRITWNGWSRSTATNDAFTPDGVERYRIW